MEARLKEEGTESEMRSLRGIVNEAEFTEIKGINES